MIIIRDKNTHETVQITSKTKALKLLYFPYSAKYLDISPLFNRILKKYEDAPLVKHVLTKTERTRLSKNPRYIENIPRYDVVGFDTAVDGIDGRLSGEFYQRFCDSSEQIVEFINQTNSKYYAEIV